MLEELFEKSLEDPNFLKDIHALMRELSNARSKGRKLNYGGDNYCYWNSMLRQPGWHTYVWRENGRIVGMGSLMLTQTPKAYLAYIHDTVVIKSCQGKGIGRAITEALIRLAKNVGVDFIELTSHESRDVARANYKKRGFKERDTGVYRLTFKKKNSRTKAGV